jgi:hypothetical protein
MTMTHGVMMTIVKKPSNSDYFHCGNDKDDDMAVIFRAMLMMCFCESYDDGIVVYNVTIDDHNSVDNDFDDDKCGVDEMSQIY